MNVRQMLEQCGLQDYIKFLTSQLQEPDYIRRKAADWSPATAFPGRLLQEWSSRQRAQYAKDDLNHTPADGLSSRLPVEIIEHIFSNLEHRDLCQITRMNRLLSPLALARLYHDICLDATLDPTGMMQCLDTLSRAPHLSSQVCSFEFLFKNDHDPAVSSVEQSLTQALASIYPYTHAVWVRGAVHSLRIAPGKESPQLRSLRLEGPGSPHLAEVKPQNVAPLLVHLEAHISFVSTIIPHLPNLRSLITVAMDVTSRPHYTQLVYNLRHRKLQKLSLVVTWFKMVDPNWVRYLVENSGTLGQLPCVKHLTFVIAVPPWGPVSILPISVRALRESPDPSVDTCVQLANLLLNFFLPKIPSVTGIILESSQDRALDMVGITKHCPHLIDIALQIEGKEWIKDQTLGRWQLFGRAALSNALQNSQTMATLEQLRTSFTACVECTVYTHEHLEVK